VVRELLAHQRPVVAIVRDAAKAREVFGTPDGLRIRQAAISFVAGRLPFSMRPKCAGS
jgi:uncharacterized protein YbjT (DUF2867 family)